MNVDANPGAVTRHMQENLCPCQKLKITVISSFRTKIAVVAKYRAKITVHCRGFWLPYKNYRGNQLPCKNYRVLPWWLATVQNIPWLPITVHQLLCNTVVAAYRGKRYRDEKSLPREALDFFPIKSVTKSSMARSSHEHRVEKFKIFVQDFVPIRTALRVTKTTLINSPSDILLRSFTRYQRRVCS